MSLFVKSNFISHSGLDLTWKLECDALDDGDWAALAHIAAERFKFGAVEGVPRGGLKFAEALMPYVTPGKPLLIVDDVLTTGKSMEEHRAKRSPAIGVVAFARGRYWPQWITPLWVLYPVYRDG